MLFRLTQKGLSLGTVESCTGGNIAQQITELAGASAYFKGTYQAAVLVDLTREYGPDRSRDGSLSFFLHSAGCGNHPLHRIFSSRFGQVLSQGSTFRMRILPLRQGGRFEVFEIMNCSSISVIAIL